MKKLLVLLCLVVFGSIKMKAQITLEHTFDTAYAGDLFYLTDLGNNDYKYVFLDKYKNSFSLYNMDMSPYLTNVVIPVTTDSINQGFSVIYITKSLFDCDSNTIEYAFQYQYNPNHAFRIFRTDGTLLFQKDSANGPYCFGCYDGSFVWSPIKNTSDGTKLFLQQRPDSTSNVHKILVYRLCGTLPNNIYDFSEHTEFVRIFPNPASGELNFEIIPPNNQENFQIVIFDSNAKEQKREHISFQQRKFSIDVASFSSGTYLYSLVGNSKTYQSGKFVIKK